MWAPVWLVGFVTLLSTMSDGEYARSDAESASGHPTQVDSLIRVQQATTSAGQPGITDPAIVKRVQQKLGFLGYPVADANGIESQGLRTAIESYQRDIGAKVTGQLSERQISLLIGAAPIAQVPEPPVVAAAAPAQTAAPLILDSVTGTDRVYFGGDKAKLAQNALNVDRLARLYILKGNPTLLDSPTSTIAFLPLVPVADANRFAVSGSGGPLRDERDIFSVTWRGANQFEQEDNRLAFLAANRAAILAMIETLPSEYIEVKPISFGTYDAETKILAIDITNIAGSPWSWQDGRVRFEAEMPVRLPETWVMEPAMARSLIEAAAAGFQRLNANELNYPGQEGRTAAVVTIRQKVTGVRPTRLGAALDLATVEMVVYDGADLRVVLGTIPLAGGAAPVAAATAGAATGAVYFDAMYPRLWAVAANPAILDNAGFIAESFDLRRKQESRAASYTDAAISFPRIVASSLLNSNKQPQQTDLDAMRIWLQTYAQNLPERVLLSGFSLFSQKASATGKPLVDILQPWQSGFAGESNTGGRDRTWLDGARAATMAALPNSVGTQPVWSGDAVPAMAALHPHPAWFGVELPFASTDTPASLELQVLSAEVRADANGRSFVLFDVIPTALVFQRGGAQERLELPMPIEPAPATGGLGFYDVANVRLGMPLSEAVATVQAFTGGAGFEQLNWTSNDPVFSAATAFRKMGANNATLETIVIFFDPTVAENPVTGIGRHLKLDDVSSDAAAIAAFLPKLEAKFGPAIEGGSSNNYYWAQSPNTIALLQAGMQYDSPCSHQGFEQFYLLENMGRFQTNSATQSCGEMMSSTINREFLTQLVTNTDTFAATRQRVQEATPAQPELGADIEF